ncbi:acyltransferase, partial [bacterium]|nr:acyltransferase [bacterium]
MAPTALQERLLEDGARAEPAPRTPRVEVLDNAKGVLIFLVVWYHIAVVYSSADRPEVRAHGSIRFFAQRTLSSHPACVSPQSPVRFWSGIVALLKAVVMPCFCLISGHLSPTQIDERRARGLCQLVATYLIFQLLYYLNGMLSFRLNGFEFKTWPVQLFHPDGQVRRTRARQRAARQLGTRRMRCDSARAWARRAAWATHATCVPGGHVVPPRSAALEAGVAALPSDALARHRIARHRPLRALRRPRRQLPEHPL